MQARCEYCRISEDLVFAAHQIDHIIAVKHRGETEIDNLALSCALCNKHKGSDIASIDPVTGEVVALYHPRRDTWETTSSSNQMGSLLPALLLAGQRSVFSS